MLNYRIINYFSGEVADCDFIHPLFNVLKGWRYENKNAECSFQIMKSGSDDEVKFKNVAELKRELIRYRRLGNE